MFFLWLPVPNFFLAPFFSFSSALVLALPFAFHVLSGCHKKLGVNFGQSLEMGTWSFIGIMGHFTTIFAPKLITLFSICYVRMWLISKIDCCADRFILALLSAYQEYLVTFQLITSQVVQRTWPVSACICMLGSQRVNCFTWLKKHL